MPSHTLLWRHIYIHTQGFCAFVSKLLSFEVIAAISTFSVDRPAVLSLLMCYLYLIRKESWLLLTNTITWPSVWPSAYTYVYLASESKHNFTMMYTAWHKYSRFAHFIPANMFIKRAVYTDLRRVIFKNISGV